MFVPIILHRGVRAIIFAGMEKFTLYQSILVLHIVAGTLALLGGIFILIRKKGDVWHRRSGRLFYYAMVIVCISAVLMAFKKSNVFLLLIGIFSFYQNYAGRRAIVNRSLQPSVGDWLVWGLALVNGVVMVVSFNFLLLVFGLISLSASFNHGRLLFRKQRGGTLPANAWLGLHIGMMMGAFIATTTAFIVANLPDSAINWAPSWVFWLSPTFIMVPLIVVWTNRYAPLTKTRKA